MINPQFSNLAKEHGLSPIYLKEIILLRAAGLDNTAIASRLGINRNTVNRYTGALRQMYENPKTREDFMRIYRLTFCEEEP